MTELLDLAQACGGLFGQVSSIMPACDEPQYSIRVARSGDLSKVWSSRSLSDRTLIADAFLSGAGVGLSDTQATIPALAEGLERYCTTLYDPAQFITASGEELGNDAVDLDTFPVCSEKELAYPDCPLRRPSKTAAIRWVKSVALLTGETKYVPAVMVYLFLKPNCTHEQICLPITTGCAAHQSFEEALLGGLLELVERDALSLTWLQSLPLPEISLSAHAQELGPDWEAYLNSSTQLECRLYDATSEVGIPTIYGLQRSATDPHLANVVSCSASLEPASAARKVLRDLVSTRVYLRPFKENLDDWRGMTELHQGAVFVGHPSRSDVFAFLWETKHRRSFIDMSSIQKASPKLSLRALLDRFRDANMNVYAIDLTSDEALRVGIRVVRVLVPELQPFSFDYRARYLGHKRLYSAPGKMGYSASAELELNHYPQPFA